MFFFLHIWATDVEQKPAHALQLCKTTTYLIVTSYIIFLGKKATLVLGKKKKDNKKKDTSKLLTKKKKKKSSLQNLSQGVLFIYIQCWTHIQVILVTAHNVTCSIVWMY